MRAIWKGHLSFGLLDIPVTLHAATGEKERISFHLLHKKDMAPVKNQRVCSLDGKVLDWNDIVRGYEYAKGQYAPVEKEEIDEVRGESSDQIELLEFVTKDAVEPISFDTPYYLRPDKGAERAYSVVRESMEQTGKIGIVRFAMRGRPHLAVLGAEKEALAMTTLRPVEEIRDVAQLDVPLRKVKAEEVEAASALIENMTEEWDPHEYRDDYRARLKALIETKIPKQKLREMKAAHVVPIHAETDLTEALRRSITVRSKQAAKSATVSIGSTRPAKSREKRHAAKHTKSTTRTRRRAG